MDRESKERLRLDRRLVRRRGHIAPDELERELSRLPDVAHKAVPLLPQERPEREPGEAEKR
jgi:hypothetical protein